MNRPFHSMVREMLNRAVSSWDRASACGHSEVQIELACRAPHAPCESQSHFVSGELRAKTRRTISDRDALNRLQLRTSDGKNSAVEAARKVSNSPDRTASNHVQKNQVPGRMWSDRVGEVNRTARIQRMLGINESFRQSIAQYEIRAQLRFQSSANRPQCSRTRATTARPIQHTILIHRLVKPSNLPSAVTEGPRLGCTGSRNYPADRLN